MDTVKLFMYWIKERYKIYEKKEAGKLPPWTKDSILQEYRFCNVHRENDRETKWIHANWIGEHYDDKHLWFAMCVARLINWSPTLAEIGYPAPWKPSKVLNTMHRIKARGDKLFTGAYIVSTNGNKIDKSEYVVFNILTPLWNNRRYLDPTGYNTLKEYHAALMDYDGMGSFMAAQVIADVKHALSPDGYEDWYTWAASGPGSRRGLNRLVGYDVKSPWKEEEWFELLTDLRTKVLKKLPKSIPLIDAQNLQNCLCEFDKYMRVKNGEGRPRSRYKYDTMDNR